MDGDATDDFRVLIAPGLHNSGPDHWQSRWQHLFPAFERVEQDDWEAPDLERWSARVDQTRRAGHGDPRPVLIVAHSFGSLATAHSVARDPYGVAGVLLVALGHINAESGLGDWPRGLETLYLLIDQVQNRTLAAH
ncbi:MAG TPA: alpha/beta hydrolase [Duganella sp.]|nr:alpha/beta hydrolase [Duganella sp.]